jgi:RNA polymerase sigma-70 factor (ECF subfamily)
VLPAPLDSDEQLVARHARGDVQAFPRLFSRHRASVAQFVARNLGARTAWADDLTQEVFIRVYRQARQFEGRSSVRTWLFGIALNVCRDHIRKERRFDVDDTVLAALPDGSLDPLQQLERVERTALVRRALATLAPRHRLMLRLREREDMSYEDISRALAVPVGTVRSRLHNARAALAQALLERVGPTRRGE